MVKKYIYCEKNFFDLCITKISNWNFSEDTFEELNLWMCLKEFFFANDIILHLDITDGELQSIISKNTKDLTSLEKNIKNLIIQKQKVGAVIKKIDSFVNIDNIDINNEKQLTAYYLTCFDSKKCEQCMRDYGVLAICPENIMNFKDILYDNGIAIKKNEQVNWNNILKFTPCNSMVLVDNYILGDTRGIDNLKNIFDVLLPNSLNIDVPFQISIFTTLKSGNQKTDIDSNKRLVEIAQMIEALRPNLYFKMAVFKCSFEKFHDRIIVTNNSYISCGGGFDFIDNGRASKTTTLNIVYPFLCKSSKWDSKAYSNILEDVKDNYDKATQFKADYLTGFYVGAKQNRLCEMIK